ncbi:MAG: DUF2934 domain-containing protein [Candidatus Zixiibacteriota bacterium]|nr:MAG: DUF2934 domain-containing protein [candidate division Zixibacteria bacterium]
MIKKAANGMEAGMPAKKKTSKKAAPKKKATKKAATKKTAAAPRPTPKIDLRTYINELNRRAYEIFQQRGSTHGHDWEDWFLAEKEVKKKYGIRE